MLSKILSRRRQSMSSTQHNRKRLSRSLLIETLECRKVLAAFTPGNLLILQSDNSTASAASAATLIEITPTGTLVQEIDIPSTGANSLVLRGNSTTEGTLSISADGQWVTFGGARLDAGSATSTNATGVPRVIGTVNPGGVVTTAQQFTDGFEGDSLRSVVTDDGSRFWLSGAGNGSSGGVRFVESTSATSSTSLMAVASGNSRQIQIIDGNLYVSSGSNVPGRSVFQVGTGLPTSGTPTFTNAFPIGPAGGAQYHSYYFADLSPAVGWNGSALDTLYTVDSNGNIGAVAKWTFDGGTWNQSGEVPFANMINIVGFTSGSNITLYGTTKQTNGSVVTITDSSGYNGLFQGGWVDLATPVVALNTAAFRGITRVPVTATTGLSIAALDATKLEGDAGTTAFTFTVNRSAPLTGTSSANYAVTGSGASPANSTDFAGGVLPLGTVEFAVGEASKTITVFVNGDLTNEPNEGFTVTLSSAVGATINQATATGTINNDDAATELSIAATSANKAEGSTGTTNFTFTVTRTGTVAGVSTTVSYAVSALGTTPAAPLDFPGNVYPSGQVSFAAGQTTALITIPVIGDTTIEPDEAFRVTLSNPTGNSSIIGFTADGLILNDDSAFAVTPGTVSTAEGNTGSSPATFIVTRSGDLNLPSTVAWSTAADASNSASANDFVGSSFPSGTINFLAGEATREIVVNIQGDTTFEVNERYLVTLDSASVGSIVTATSTGVILNDEFQNLSAGDIVITSLFADNPDAFSFVPLVDLAPNSSIAFTDNAWNGSALLTNEGVLTYTAPASGLSKGTKVALEYDSASGNITFLAGTGSASILGNFGFSTDGDSILAYVGLPASPTFLFGVTTFGEYLTAGTPNSNQTYLPSTLTIGTSAVAALGLPGPPADEVDNAQYMHSSGTTGTPAQIRALVANRANWNTFDLPTETIDTSNFTVNAPSATVVGRQLFYNRSTSTIFGNGSGNPVNAIDSTKSALLPGQTATFANYSNYSRGLNGILVDINGLTTATAADFAFATSNGTNPFVATTAVPTITVIAGGGTGGSSRVKIEFDNDAIRNTWLRVTVLANANTGLSTNDIFYFGSAVGDLGVGNLAGPPVTVRTNASDTSAVRQFIAANPGAQNPNSVPITSVQDLNKDGRVNPSDIAVPRQSTNSGSIVLFTAPSSVTLAINSEAESTPGVTSDPIARSTVPREPTNPPKLSLTFLPLNQAVSTGQSTAPKQTVDEVSKSGDSITPPKNLVDNLMAGLTNFWS